MRPRLVGLLGLALLAGCGGASNEAAPTSSYDSERESAVAADSSATADEIIEAGGPVRVATSQDHTLVAWRAESGDDEGPQQAAWRLYDKAGKRIADGTLGQVVEAGAIPTLTPVADGFLLENYTGHIVRHVDRDGQITEVRSSSQRRSTRAGDVLPQEVRQPGYVFYRPSDHTTYRLPKLPSAAPEGVALDADGRVWILADWSRTRARVKSSQGGSGPWQDTAVPLPPGGAPSMLTAAADRMLLPTVMGDDQPPPFAGLWSHPVDGDPGTEWTQIPTDGVTLTQTWQPRVDALTDGRLLLAGESGDAWLQDDDDTFVEVSPPPGDSALLEAAGSRLFASFTRDHQLYVSDDGQSWEVFDR